MEQADGKENAVEQAVVAPMRITGVLVVCANCGERMQATMPAATAIEHSVEFGGVRAARRVWRCVEYTCMHCGARILTEFPYRPIASRGSTNFAITLEEARAEEDICPPFEF